MASNKSQQPKKGAPSAPQKGKSGQQSNQPRKRRVRRGRGRKNNKGGGPMRGDGMSGLSSVGIPKNLAYMNRESRNSQPRSINDKRWGEGISLPFSQLITTIQPSNAGGPYDAYIPILTSQLISADLVASGIQDTGTTTCSGLLVHPFMLGGRFISETNNWTRYRFRKLCVVFVPFTGTNTEGAIIMHVNGDSNKWPEAVEDSKSALIPSITNLSSARPMVEGPVWTEQGTCVQFTGQETWPCEVNTATYDDTTGFLGGLSYIREAYQYRVAVLTENVGSGTALGRLYLTGVIEFFQPSFGSVSGAGVTTAPTSSSLSSTSVPSIGPTKPLVGRWSSRPVVGSKEPILTDPHSDDFVFPPTPILERKSAIEKTHKLTRS